MQKRITIIGDKKIITDFKALCRNMGMFHSKIVVGMMANYLAQYKIQSKVTSGKKTKSV